MNNTVMNLNNENIWQVYLSNPVYPGKVKLSTVMADNLSQAKEKALSMYPGWSVFNYYESNGQLDRSSTWPNV
jgi:hypothetical protein